MNILKHFLYVFLVARIALFSIEGELVVESKDLQAIAIDLNAGNGKSAIGLSDHFNHVIAVESDIDELQKNLAVSKCFNVTICPTPIFSVKLRSSEGDRKPSLTFKQLLFDYIFANEELKDRRIGLIKCDIEEGEENLLEDVLYFAYNNKCLVYLSFHPDFWKSHKVSDFNYLFKYFKTDFSDKGFCQTYFLFEPLQDVGSMIKKNISAFIIGYNLVTYIKNMIKQLEKYTSDIIVIDNNSSFQPLIDYYNNDFKYTLLKQKENYGYKVWQRSEIQKLAGEVFILTDPDLLFNERLPDNFIQKLIQISHYFKANRVGFALFIDSDDIKTDILFWNKHSIKEWERQFWIKRMLYPPDTSLELYSAGIDTTFCLINQRYNTKTNIRVAGDYTCRHLPWYIDFEKELEEGELESYLKANNSSSWIKKT
jgi:hypothetical protein